MTTRLFPTGALALALLCTASSGFAPRALAQNNPCHPADNSAQNKNHKSENADKQSNATEDRLTTQKIRKAIVGDKDLSTYAHNVKIITHAGAVTLKGPVKSDSEKDKVAADAASVVSADKITNQLTVKQ